MEELDLQSKLLYKSALKKLTGCKRRAFAAELCTTYFNGSARKTERAFANQLLNGIMHGVFIVANFEFFDNMTGGEFFTFVLFVKGQNCGL